MLSPIQERRHLRVVLFSGGRGSGALTTQLVAHPGIDLSVAINGYDDGASTGEVRRFLGDSLGPSDFRKNAVRLSRLLQSSPPALADFLELRLEGLQGDAPADRLVRAASGASDLEPALQQLAALAALLPHAVREAIRERLARFAAEMRESGRPFAFVDCSLGNLVFAGGFLLCGRDFNRAVDDYCALLGLRPGLIENVTDGGNAFLVALDADGRLLGSEEAIVDATRRNRIEDIFLLRERLRDDEIARASALPPAELRAHLQQRAAAIRLNERLAAAVAAADLIIYAPGTQHSSLFPSYLTPGLSDAVARNLTAIKLLVTNIQTDAEITGSSAVDIIERAVFYLKEKGRLSIATPRLITHYLVNDPRESEVQTPYVPLGRLESLEDPRLVRVANYEQGGSGRHDATKILGPFVDSFLARWHGSQKVTVYLYESHSTNKVVQSLLEMVRAGIRDLPVTLTVYHDAPADLETGLIEDLGFRVLRLQGTEAEREAALRRALAAEEADYLALFESSGMYNGEDLVALASHLHPGRLDAVWGSRRLSVKDIHASYRLRYRHRTVLGAISYAGSHVLSLLYLALYGRYVSDTLSGARVVRATHAARVPGLLTDKLANQHLLSVLLRQKAEMLEVPVQFTPISPQQVRRTSAVEGLAALWTVLRGRIRRFAPEDVTDTTPRTDVRPEAPSRAQTR